MNDRFKFRAWVKVYYYDKDDNDKSLNLKFDDIDVMQNGFIGFSLGQLREVLDKTSLTEEEKESVIDYLNANNSTYTDDAYLIGWGTVEQCTGAKDRNGKLIYEGDLFQVDESDELIYAKVIWDDKQARFMVEVEYPHDEYDLDDNGSPFYDELSDWLDQPIIGNIHENPELLEFEDWEIVE